MHWVTNSVHFYGGVPLVPASLITLLLCAYLAIYPALFGAALSHIRKNHPSLAFLAAPALWTALELARTYVFSGFPWSLLGYTQYTRASRHTGCRHHRRLRHLVPYRPGECRPGRAHHGPETIHPGLHRRGRSLRFVLCYGVLQIRSSRRNRGHGFKISVIQGNIEQDQKWDPAYQTQVTRRVRTADAEALEAASGPHPLAGDRNVLFTLTAREAPTDQTVDLGPRRLRKDRTSVPLLFGSPTYEVLPGQSGSSQELGVPALSGRHGRWLSTTSSTSCPSANMFRSRACFFLWIKWSRRSATFRRETNTRS